LESPAQFLRAVEEVDAQREQWVVTSRAPSKDPAAEFCQGVSALFGFHEFRFGVTLMSGNWSI
jgi:hypothetical protein